MSIPALTQPDLPWPGPAALGDRLRDIRNYLAGQALGATRDETLLEEVLKCAFCRVDIERNPGRSGLPPDADSLHVAAEYARRLRRITTANPRLFGPKAKIKLSPDQVAFVNRRLAGTGILAASRDVIGEIYEAFIGAAVRGQDGQFFTPRAAVELLVALVAPAAGETVLDPACGAGAFLLTALQHAGGQRGGKPSVVGIDKDAYLVRLAELHVALHFPGAAELHCADSLAWEGASLAHSAAGARAGTFQVLLTNPPFGARIMAASGPVLRSFELAARWRRDRHTGRFRAASEWQVNPAPQVLFLERCLKLLAPGGRLGIVLPESLLCSPSHGYAMQFLLERAVPTAVIGMPEALFKSSGKGGTHTKVCLLACEKRPPRTADQVFMAEAKWCGHDSRGRPIPRNDLPAIQEAYQQHRRAEPITPSHLGFSVPLAEIRHGILAPRYYDPEPGTAIAALGQTHESIAIHDLITSGAMSTATGDEPGKLAYGSGPIPFVRTSDLSNWEIKLDPKHRVSEEYYRQVASRQDVCEGDILLVRDGTYLIGTCAMVTRYDTRICFQSHILKIRLAAHGLLNPFLLLALLSSRPVQAQVRALSFSQDIIDSLGDRLRDVVLPVPRSPERRAEITAMVRKVIEDRIEARELARQARRLAILP